MQLGVGDKVTFHFAGILGSLGQCRPPARPGLGALGLRMPGWLWARVHGPSAGERSFPLPAGFRSPFIEPMANSRDIGNLQTGERPHPPLPGPAHFSS